MYNFFYRIFFTTAVFLLFCIPVTLALILIRSAIFWQWEPYPWQWGILFRLLLIGIYLRVISVANQSTSEED